MKRNLIFLILMMAYAYAGAWYPLVRNFDAKMYPGGAQNWCVTQTSEGMMCFGNRDGMLIFDGHRWHSRRLPGSSTVRALLYDAPTRRVYAGGSGEFGYFHISPDGAEEFVNLSSTLPSAHRDFHEIWDIHRSSDGTICFRGDKNLYLFRPGKDAAIRRLAIPHRLAASGTVGGDVYVADDAGGVYRLHGSALRRVANTAALHGARVVGVFTTPSGAPGFVTAQHGLFRLDAGSVNRIVTPIDDFLTENQPFCVTASGVRLALGTVYAGAVEYNMATGKARYINKSTGMRDNTVLALTYDRADNLWMCLDNGLAYAMTGLPVSSLLGGGGNAGTGYASLRVGASLLLGTNRALYALPWPARESATPPSLTKLLGGQIWRIDSVGGNIMISSDMGLYQSLKSAPTAIRRVEGVPDSWCVIPLRRHPGYALASGYTSLYLLKLSGGSWVSCGAVAGYSDIGGRLTEDTNGNVWLPHWRKGIYCLQIDVEHCRCKRVRLYTSADGLPSDNNNSVYISGGKVYATTERGLYSLASGRWVPDPLGKSVPLHSAAHLYDVGGGRLLALSQNQSMLVTPDGYRSVLIDSVAMRQVSLNVNPGFDHVSHLTVGEDALLVAVQDGFYHVDMQRLRRHGWHPPLIVSGVYAKGDSLLYHAGGNTPGIARSIAYALNSLRFEFSNSEYYDENCVAYSSMLKGYEKEYSPYSSKPYREYTGLPEGEYTLMVRCRNALTGMVSHCEFRFSIAPPWYRSVWAKIVYSLMALAALYYGVRAALLWRLHAEQRMERRKEEEIEALKSAQLEQDIKHKSSELSNITMNVIRKNEILLDISSRLSRLQSSLAESSHSDLVKIQTLIRENISHDDDWKNFSQNFDIVYEDYTKRLRAAHPTLSPNDLRICCYIKMGLSNKDIAPLTNISPRSVEMSRYRLRKKLNLEQGANLSSYLASF